jgi:hypothetical protein
MKPIADKIQKVLAKPFPVKKIGATQGKRL